MTDSKRCYIAGPMTGRPGFNYIAFDWARDVLTEDGWDVISPADLDRVNLNIDFSVMTGTEDLSEHVTTFARQDIDALLKVDAVFALDGWEQSTGAMNELRIAAMLGVPSFAFETRAPITVDGRFSNAPTGKPQPLSHRADLLREAEGIVDGDRNVQYGDPLADFRRTAAMWSAYLGTPIETHDVATLMALLKISRIRWSPSKRDLWTDLAGYAACGWHCVATEATAP